MGVDFRLLNKRGDASLKKTKELLLTFSNEELWGYLNLRFMPKDLHYHPYCPKPNEPDDIATFQPLI